MAVESVSGFGNVLSSDVAALPQRWSGDAKCIILQGGSEPHSFVEVAYRNQRLWPFSAAWPYRHAFRGVEICFAALDLSPG